MVYCEEIAAYLDTVLCKNLYPQEEIPTLWQQYPGAVHRIGLALEPVPGMGDWIREEKLDALFLHRPWKMADYPLPGNIAIIACHLPFDEQLTVGYNRHLARLLPIQDVQGLGSKEGRPVGITGSIKPVKDTDLLHQLASLFAGIEESFQVNGKTVDRVAFVGAMSGQLIAEAAASRVGLYITGQFRNGARKAAIHTGMGVIAVGHRRSEIFGLHLLAQLLHDQWPQLMVVVNSP